MDKLVGANENRFVSFNNMPRVSTKYVHYGVRQFNKQISRDDRAKSDRTNKYLQDYDVAPPTLDVSVISFNKTVDRPPVEN